MILFIISTLLLTLHYIYGQVFIYVPYMPFGYNFNEFNNGNTWKFMFIFYIVWVARDGFVYIGF